MKVNITNIKQFLNTDPYDLQARVDEVHNVIHNKTGLGSEYLGWLDLPNKDYSELLTKLDVTANKIRKQSKVLVVIGIGGSYLGSKAGLEFMKVPFSKDEIEIVYAGHQMSGRYLNNLVKYLEDKDFSVNVISKSGQTIEPAIAFRVLKKLLLEKYGTTETTNRIYVTTDKARGALYEQAIKSGYERYVIADDIGGRFSVLTEVGLLPFVVAGLNVKEMLKGASDAYNNFQSPDLKKNQAYLYAVSRYLLYKSGKKIEMLASYEPNLKYFSEWWKQLYGESEGKDHKGLFVASANFSTDLHSLGQYIQDGERHLFETIIEIDTIKDDVVMDKQKDNNDGLNYLSGKTLSYINKQALKGTMMAHVEGGVPNILISIPNISEHTFGYMVYFFELACAMSAYLLEVNPFDQMGVEDYKIKMFELLGKEGY